MSHLPTGKILLFPIPFQSITNPSVKRPFAKGIGPLDITAHCFEYWDLNQTDLERWQQANKITITKVVNE